MFKNFFIVDNNNGVICIWQLK